MTDFEKLFLKRREFVYGYLLRLTSNHSLAEELTDETFFRAYINYSGLRDKNKASTWLCQIAKNTYFAWYNENKKKETLEHTEIIDLSQNIEQDYITKEQSQKALECIDALDEPYREVFIMSVFHGISFKEISNIFEKSESWARVTFYRAKQKITEKMENENGL